MEIELRLKEFLQRHHLDHHGVVKEISRRCGVHRHTIGKIYRNQMSHPSLEVLGRICRWLEEKGVPDTELPHGLFGLRPSELWRAISASGAVNIYLGEYQQVYEGEPNWRWIARRDAAVATWVVQHVTTPGDNGRGRTPTVRMKYVPFRFTTRASSVTKAEFQEDALRARGIFERLRSAGMPESAILIGSQRVNYLVEYLVADLFGCEPFTPPGRSVQVPFYLAYRGFNRVVPSCFGGLKNPPGRRGKVRPGTYYLDGDGKWTECEFVEREQDAGMVISVYRPSNRTMQMAMFGFTGWGTEALGRLLDQSPESFWPPTISMRGRRIGIYVCRMTFTKQTAQGLDNPVEVDHVEIVKLSKDILKEYLRLNH